MNISPYKLAKDIKISATRVSEIIKGKRRITIDTALRLSKYFGINVEFWVGIQADYEMENEERKQCLNNYDLTFINYCTNFTCIFYKQ